MGGSVGTFSPMDSPSAAGQQSLVSDEISGVGADKLLETMEKYIRAGKTVHPKASKSNVSDKDGGILLRTVFEIPAMFGGGEIVQYSLYKIDAANSTVQIDSFPTEFSYERKQPLTSSWSKVLTGPVRVEFWQDAHEVRSSGRFMQGMLNKVFEFLEVPPSAKADQPSIGAEGCFSAVSEPIESSTVTPETYFDQFRKFLVDEMGATELPDGTIIEERSSMFGELVGSASYAKHVFKPEEGHLYCHEFGDDESMTNEIGITHVQVHKDPFRVEQWNVQKAQRLTGNAQKKLVEEFVKGVLTYMQEA